MSVNWNELLVGKSVASARRTDNGGELTLSDGTIVGFKDASDCCSWIEVTDIAGTDNIITSAEEWDDEARGEYGETYSARLVVLTEAGEFNLVEAKGNPGNGYYIHGFGLDVYVNGKQVY